MNNSIINEAEMLSQHLLDTVWEWIPDVDYDGYNTDSGRLATVEIATDGQPELHDVIEIGEVGGLVIPNPDDREFIVAAPRLVQGLLNEVERLRNLNEEMARALTAARHGKK